MSITMWYGRMPLNPVCVRVCSRSYIDVHQLDTHAGSPLGSPADPEDHLQWHETSGKPGTIV